MKKSDIYAAFMSTVAVVLLIMIFLKKEIINVNVYLESDKISSQNTGTYFEDYFVLPERSFLTSSVLVSTPRADQLFMKDLRTGDIVAAHGKNTFEYILIVIPPFWINGDCQFTYVDWPKEESDEFIGRGYCADYGLIPYEPTGFWNKYNYLTETDMKLPFMEVVALTRGMRNEP